MRMRRAGQRRHFVALEAQETVATATGFTPAWVPYGRVFAEILPASAGQGERPIASTTDAVITHLVETDYRVDVRVSHRVRTSQGQLLYVVGMPENVEMRNKTMVIPCEEREERAA